MVAAGRHPEALTEAFETGVTTDLVDLTDASIVALGERLGRVDHVVSTASPRARGRLTYLTREAVHASLDTKVIGPLMLAKYLPGSRPGGSPSCSPGLRRSRSRSGRSPSPPLTRSLALDLTPIRVCRLPRGHRHRRMGRGEKRKAALSADMSARHPTRRIGIAEDDASAVLFAMTNTFLTGTTIPVDGGEEPI